MKTLHPHPQRQSTNVKLYNIQKQDGSGQYTLQNITEDHPIFKTLTPIDKWPPPEILEYSMDHTFVKDEKGTEYRIILWNDQPPNPENLSIRRQKYN